MNTGISGTELDSNVMFVFTFNEKTFKAKAFA